MHVAHDCTIIRHRIAIHNFFLNVGVCDAVTLAMNRHLGGDLVATMLQWSSGSAAVAQWGCSAIYMLAKHQTREHQQALANSGACEAVVKALLRFGTVEEVALAGCLAVVALAREVAGAKDLMGAVGACAALTAVIQEHISNVTVIEWSCLAVDILAAVHEGTRE